MIDLTEDFIGLINEISWISQSTSIWRNSICLRRFRIKLSSTSGFHKLYYRYINFVTCIMLVKNNVWNSRFVKNKVFLHFWITILNYMYMQIYILWPREVFWRKKTPWNNAFYICSVCGSANFDIIFPFETYKSFIIILNERIWIVILFSCKFWEQCFVLFCRLLYVQ